MIDTQLFHPEIIALVLLFSMFMIGFMLARHIYNVGEPDMDEVSLDRQAWQMRDDKNKFVKLV